MNYFSFCCRLWRERGSCAATATGYSQPADPSLIGEILGHELTVNQTLTAGHASIFLAPQNSCINQQNKGLSFFPPSGIKPTTGSGCQSGSLPTGPTRQNKSRWNRVRFSSRLSSTSHLIKIGVKASRATCNFVCLCGGTVQKILNVLKLSSFLPFLKGQCHEKSC